MSAENAAKLGSKNSKGFVAGIVLTIASLAIVVAAFLTSHGLAATLGVISGVGLVLLGQALRRPAVTPNRRTNAIAAAAGVAALPAIGLAFGPGVKDGTATFVAGLLLPACGFLVVAALVPAAKDADYWRR